MWATATHVTEHFKQKALGSVLLSWTLLIYVLSSFFVSNICSSLQLLNDAPVPTWLLQNLKQKAHNVVWCPLATCLENLKAQQHLSQHTVL